MFFGSLQDLKCVLKDRLKPSNSSPLKALVYVLSSLKAFSDHSVPRVFV